MYHPGFMSQDASTGDQGEHESHEGFGLGVQPGSGSPGPPRRRRTRRATALGASSVRLRVLAFRLGCAAAASGMVVLEAGFHAPVVDGWILRIVQVLLLGLCLGNRVWRMARRIPAISGEGSGWTLWALVVLAAAGILGVWFEPDAWRLVEAAALLTFASELWRFNVGLSRTLANPGVLFPASFVTLILLGTVLLKTPMAVAPGSELSWLDALFTMTSAVCVTGLVVKETGTDFTPFGQGIIALFIQLGALGIILFGSTLAMLLGRSLSYRENLNLSEMLQDQPLDRLNTFARFILLSTLGIVALGAVLLYPMWDAADAPTTERRLGMSVFHAISAFCNAGFDLTGDSLIGYRHAWLTHAVIAPLIILGGLGYPVLENLARVTRYRIVRRLRRRPGRPAPIRSEQSELERPGLLAPARITLHTKLVIVTTLGVYIYGVLALSTAQILGGAMDDGWSWGGTGRMFLDSSFLSIASRTAGFTPVPMDELEHGSIFALITLMIIGGSPGGTAGGVKTTVLAVLVLSVIATIRQRPETEAFGRTISDAIVRKAGTIGVCYLFLIGATTLLLMITEEAPFEVVLFEAVSAATVTGLSLGLTPELSSTGKSVVIVTMFLGRVGPLALLGALMFGRRTSRPYMYAHENVALG